MNCLNAIYGSPSNWHTLHTHSYKWIFSLNLIGIDYYIIWLVVGRICSSVFEPAVAFHYFLYVHSISSNNNKYTEKNEREQQYLIGFHLRIECCAVCGSRLCLTVTQRARTIWTFIFFFLFFVATVDENHKRINNNKNLGRSTRRASYVLCHLILSAAVHIYIIRKRDSTR